MAQANVIFQKVDLWNKILKFHLLQFLEKDQK